MRTVGSERKHLCTAAHQQNLVIAHSSEEFAAVGKFSRGDAFRQIGANQSAARILCHGLILVESPFRCECNIIARYPGG
jgi:hypothetical protein